MALRRRIIPIVTTILLYSSTLLAAEPAQVPNAKPEVSCELKVRESYQYYDLDGEKLCDLQKQINENGTKWDDGRTYAAVTSWDLKYSYDVAHEDGKASVKSVKTDLNIIYHLPRRTCTTSPPELTRLWDNYLVNLKQHEFGHKDLAVKVAGELNETLASLQGFSDQTDLDQVAKRLTDEKLQRLKDVQVEYDAETGHGETQGAVLAAN